MDEEERVMIDVQNKKKYSDAEQLDAWINWKETCALLKCSEDNKKILGNLALWFFNKKVKFFFVS